MEWGEIVRVAVALLVAVCVIIGGLGAISVVWRRRCPQCGRRALRPINAYRATVVEDGQRRPDSWEIFCCRSCKQGFKRHRDQWSAVDDPFTPHQRP